jgi:7-cyano-7-deazaguanine synthase
MKKNRCKSPGKAVVLLSGGLDSATTLFFARRRGFAPACLIFDYGQRHSRELISAKKVARAALCTYEVVRIRLPWKGSSLLDQALPIVPSDRVAGHAGGDIPATYVPGRNMIFLSFALSYAETIGASAVFIGANTVDYSGYPDCSPAFLSAVERAAAVGTKAGAIGSRIKIIAPLIGKTKAQIVEMAVALGVPLRFTWSCYKGGKRPCGVCDSCIFRAKGFAQAGFKDPAL